MLFRSEVDSTDSGLQKEHDEDFVRRVRGGGDRVGRENRECDELAQPLVFLVGTRDRLAEKKLLEGTHPFTLPDAEDSGRRR